jgi:hypothetical protein
MGVDSSIEADTPLMGLYLICADYVARHAVRHRPLNAATEQVGQLRCVQTGTHAHYTYT